MAQTRSGVQIIDMIASGLKARLPGISMRVRERVETLRGKGWGVRVERELRETTFDVLEGEDSGER